MTIAAPPSGLQPEDYEEIEAAVMETARGRWFLAEFARRTRFVEGEMVLAAIARLEARLEARGALAPEEPLSVARRLTELAWMLRERGVEDFVCGKIDALAREFSSGAKAGQGSVGDARRRASVETKADTLVEPSPQPRLDPSSASLDDRPPPEPVAAASDAFQQASPPTPDPRLAALLWLDRLPLVDRMALFA